MLYLNIKSTLISFCTIKICYSFMHIKIKNHSTILKPKYVSTNENISLCNFLFSKSTIKNQIMVSIKLKYIP